MQDGKLKLSNEVKFEDNIAKAGGAVYAENSDVTPVNGRYVFDRNNIASSSVLAIKVDVGKNVKVASLSFAKLNDN